MKLIFRKTGPEDLDILLKLRLDFLAEVNGTPEPPSLRENLHRYFAEALPAGDFLAHLALLDGEIVGVSAMVVIRRPPSHSNPTGRYAHILNVYTLPQWRGHGIATALFERTLGDARAQNCGKATLHATAEGRPLYEKFGFQTAEGEPEMSLKL